MKEKINMHYEPGRGVMVHKLNTVSDRHLEDFRREAVKAIEIELKNRRVLRRQPKKRSKLRRFLRRLWLTHLHNIDRVCDMIVGTPSAADYDLIVWEEKV